MIFFISTVCCVSCHRHSDWEMRTVHSQRAVLHQSASASVSGFYLNSSLFTLWPRTVQQHLLSWVPHRSAAHLSRLCVRNKTSSCQSQLVLIHLTRVVGSKQIASSVSVRKVFRLYSHPATYPRSPLSAHDTSSALRSEPAGGRWSRPGCRLLIYSCGKKRFF